MYHDSGTVLLFKFHGAADLVIAKKPSDDRIPIVSAKGGGMLSDHETSPSSSNNEASESSQRTDVVAVEDAIGS